MAGFGLLRTEPGGEREEKDRQAGDHDHGGRESAHEPLRHQSRALLPCDVSGICEGARSMSV